MGWMAFLSQVGGVSDEEKLYRVLGVTAEMVLGSTQADSTGWIHTTVNG